MARVKMVTRTVVETVASLLCMDVVKAEAQNVVLSIPGEFKTTQDVVKAAQRIRDTATFKVVACTEYHTTEKLYGMPESEFIAHAKLLPPRSKTADAEEQ